MHRKIHSNLALTTLAGQSTTNPRYTPSELFDIIGPSPRYCFRLPFIKNTGNPEVDIDYGDPSGLFKDTNTLLNVLLKGHAPPEEQEEEFYRFFFCMNLKDNPSVDHPPFGYTIPTDYLCNRIANYYRRKDKKEKFALLALFAPLPQLAGIFTSRL
jgi:hypothetical protein